MIVPVPTVQTPRAGNEKGSFTSEVYILFRYGIPISVSVMRLISGVLEKLVLILPYTPLSISCLCNLLYE